MALKPQRVKQNSKSNLKSPLLDPDNYPARLVQVIDLGLQNSYFDQDKINHEVMLTYELTTEFCLDEDDNPVEDKPRWLSETINIIDLPIGMSVDEIYNDQYRGKAKMVLRSRAFDPKGTLEFDFSEMVGKPCAVTVVQKKKKDKTLKNEIGGITAPMRGLQIAELINPPKVFVVDEPDMEIFGSLPEWLQDKIKGNLEFKGSALEAAINGKEPEKEAKADTKTEAEPTQDAQEEYEEEPDDEKPW